MTPNPSFHPTCARKRPPVEQMFSRNLFNAKKQPPETLISEDWNPPNDKGGGTVGGEKR